MKKKTFLLIVFAVFAIISCKNKSNDNSNQSNTNNTEVKNNKTSKGKYDFKSGIITLKSTVMGMEQKYVIYFDDYGKKEATDVIMEMMGVKVHSRSFIKDGYIYSLEMNEKKGTKTKYVENYTSNMDFNNIPEDIAKDMNLKKTGKETFMGKDCDVYTIDYKSMSTAGKFLVWKGIALKTEMNSGGTTVVMEATDIQENVRVDDDIFEIPSDFTIEEKLVE